MRAAELQTYSLDTLLKLYYGDGPESCEDKIEILQQRHQLFERFAEQRMFDVAVPKKFGGQGLSVIQLAEFFEMAGYSLLPSRIYSAALAAHFLLENSTPQQQQEHLSALAKSAPFICLVMDSRKTWFEVDSSIRVKAVKGGFELNGVVDFVLDGFDTNLWLVPGSDANKKISTFLLKKTDKGISLKRKPSVDPSFPLSQIALRKVFLPTNRLIGTRGGAKRALKSTALLGTLLQSASHIGSAARACDIVIAHSKSRIIGGGPIARFQTLAHRMVDMHIANEKARSMVGYAAIALNNEGLYVSMAKTAAEHALLTNAQEGIQIHGASAFQWQHPMNFFFRRGLLAKTLGGPTALHYDLITTKALKPSIKKPSDPKSHKKNLLPLASFDIS